VMTQVAHPIYPTNHAKKKRRRNGCGRAYLLNLDPREAQVRPLPPNTTNKKTESLRILVENTLDFHLHLLGEGFFFLVAAIPPLCFRSLD